MLETNASDLYLLNEIEHAEIWMNACVGHVLISAALWGYEIKWREAVASDFF